ncbi:16S rRNA (adenine(1518)-N(6)/adenine(1519)-N(6))-dimethyltransferase RsmA [Bacteroidota bacterium]
MTHIKKKYLGQHFLHDKKTVEKVASSLKQCGLSYSHLLEIGPGEGSLTSFLVKLDNIDLHLVEIDKELNSHLHLHYSQLEGKIHLEDFLQMDLHRIFKAEQVGVIGNFPYNISSQILIKVIENREIIPEMVGMFQKEVAQRVTAKPGSKVYGRITVIVNAFYDTEYLFSVSKGVFSPPPQVESAVIRLTRKENFHLACNERKFSTVVASAFNQRRKTLRNALKSLLHDGHTVPEDILDLRAERLSVDDFIMITNNL